MDTSTIGQNNCSANSSGNQPEQTLLPYWEDFAAAPQHLTNTTSNPIAENKLYATPSPVVAPQQAKSSPEVSDSAPLPTKSSAVGASLSRLENSSDKTINIAPSQISSQGTKRNRLTRKQRDILLCHIAQDYNEGLPTTAIMRRHGLSRTQVKEYLAELFLSEVITKKDSAFEVINVTGTLKKLLCINENWDYIKIEKMPGCEFYTLREYKGD